VSWKATKMDIDHLAYICANPGKAFCLGALEA